MLSSDTTIHSNHYQLFVVIPKDQSPDHYSFDGIFGGITIHRGYKLYSNESETIHAATDWLASMEAAIEEAGLSETTT